MTKTKREAPINNRDDPDVLQSVWVGAVMCPGCAQVHIDLLDIEDKIIATASLDPAQWLDLVEHMEGQMAAWLERERQKRASPPPQAS